MLFFPSFFPPYSQSPAENANIKKECGVAGAKDCSPSTEEGADSKNNSCISKEESHWDSCDSDGPCADNAVEGEEECTGAKKSRVKLRQVESEADAAYPEPRLPYPCMSSLSSKEQKMYLDILMSKKTRVPPQVPTFSP